MSRISRPRLIGRPRRPKVPGASSHQVKGAIEGGGRPNASCIHRVALAARDTIVRGFALPAAPGALRESRPSRKRDIRPIF
ncbi:protein of unknown function [Methylocella tundrae]|uniref:Uncharacterized protein n=1 Tax=Methylocella tundrae TaxID=227605 RepID=A0A4U8Z0E8_METTU|nr:protein of unknown function [Methylocella tundrae]